QIALGQPHGTPELARRHVDQHQVHGPAAKPVLGLCRRPGRQCNFMAVVTAHPRAMHSNLATIKTDLSLGPAPAVADPASATMMRRAGELPRVLAKHLLDGSDPGRQTEALKGAVHILPSRLEASDEGVVIVVMALLSFADSTPRPSGSRSATPLSLIQQ